MIPTQRRAAHTLRVGGCWQALVLATLFASPAAGQLHILNPLDLPASARNITWTGSVTSQGDAVIGGPLARSSFGVNGNGIKVGVISDSFNLHGGQPAGIASGNLPGIGNPDGFFTPVNILNDDNFPDNIDEGRAIAEIIHDVAPGAQILFHSAFNNPESSPGGSIAVAINNLVAAGANVIVDDVFDLRAPIYQDGAAAQAVNNAFASGVAYFSSAGNNANNAYEGNYSPFQIINHDFDANANEGGSNVLEIGTIPNNGSFVAALWWDDPYTSLGGVPSTDFELGLYNITDDLVEGGSIGNQLAGDDPWEAFGFTNTSGAAKSYGLFVEYAGGDPDKLLKIQVLGTTIQDDDDTNSPTTGGHNSAAGALSVGAAPFFNPNSPEFYTAAGPTTILYDADGNPLAVPEIRNTPTLTGIDGGNTSFFFADSVVDADTFPNFFGTSASAPHVAAIAALVLERAAQLGQVLSPADLYDLLVNSTIDIGAPGYDNITGYGRLDAYLAVSAVIPEPASMAMLLLACAAPLGTRVRRRDG